MLTSTGRLGLWLTVGCCCTQGHVNVSIVDNTFHAAGDRATPAHWGKNTTGSGKHAIAVQSGTLLTLHGTSQRFSGRMQMGDR